MPESVSITGTGAFADLMKQLAPAQLVKPLKVAAYKIGEQVRTVISKDPGPPDHPIKWKSQKQRKYYFASRRAANLPAKYTRTSDPMSEKLSQSWVVDANAAGAVVGNPATYGPNVVSADKQEPMHAATGWITDKQAVETVQKSGAMGRIIDGEIGAFLGGIRA